MDLWIIFHGEKTGPIHDFEVRRKISDGELTADTHAWHEGMDQWKPLSQIDLFRREFELLKEPVKPDPEPPAADSPTPPPLPAKPVYARRFWARWLDLTLYSGLWWLGMWTAGQNIEAALLNPWIMFLHYVPWFALEPVLIHRFGTTPGKWMLGLRVENLDGSQLDLAAASRRSLRILFTGVGFGWGLLAVFCQIISYFVSRRLGTTLWDQTGGHRVASAPLKPWRIIVLPFLYFLALQMQLIVVFPYMLEMVGRNFPTLKEQYEKNPPWHLPKKSQTQP
jgi:uncharacterized RDD family membrane protein YckC